VIVFAHTLARALSNHSFSTQRISLSLSLCSTFCVYLGENVLTKMETKAKSAFTRLYNSTAHTSQGLASLQTTSKKRKGGGGGGDDDEEEGEGEYDDDEDGGGGMADDDEASDDDLSMFQAKKAKTSAAASAPAAKPKPTSAKAKGKAKK
jgi:hypothetical protein